MSIVASSRLSSMFALGRAPKYARFALNVVVRVRSGGCMTLDGSSGKQCFGNVFGPDGGSVQGAAAAKRVEQFFNPVAMGWGVPVSFIRAEAPGRPVGSGAEIVFDARVLGRGVSGGVCDRNGGCLPFIGGGDPSGFDYSPFPAGREGRVRGGALGVSHRSC